jgi:hypothetical protein
MNKSTIIVDRPHPQKRLTRAILFTIIASAVFQAGCNTNRELKAAQYELALREQHLIELENFAERTPDVERAKLNEEERIITLKSKVYGQTDEKADKINGSGSYNAYLVIAKRPPVSMFDVPKDQRPPTVDDRIRSLPDVISVKLLRRVAQDSSAATRKDPLGLFSENSALQDCLKAANPTDPLGLYKEDETHANQRKACIDKFGK